MYLCPTNINIMERKDELILLNINGTDRPGVTAEFCEILARNNAAILDIGLVNIHSNLSLGILFEGNEAVSGNLLKELLLQFN